MGKLNVAFIVRRHWRSIVRNPNTDAKQVSFTLLYALIPLALGALWVILKLTTEVIDGRLDSSTVMTAVSILVGFLLALLIWVFQLRRDYEPSNFVTTDSDVSKLLDELFTNTSYAVLVAGVVVVATVPIFRLPQLASTVADATICVLLAHLGLTLLILVRRMAIAYEKLAKEKDDERKALRQGSPRTRIPQ